MPADWVVRVPAGLTARDAMTLGTAGFTAARSVIRLEQNGLAPGSGPVIVTGATGGVGSIAVAILAGLGYQVTAMTGKDAEHGLSEVARRRRDPAAIGGPEERAAAREGDVGGRGRSGRRRDARVAHAGR